MDLVDKIIELTDLFDDNVVTTADKIPQPEPRKDVLDREAINRFMKDNPPGMAGGGRINFDGGGSPLQKFRQEIVESMKPYAPDDVTEDQLQLVVKDITLDMTAEQAQASALSNFRKLFGMAKGGRIGFGDGSITKIKKLQGEFKKDPKLVKLFNEGKLYHYRTTIGAEGGPKDKKAYRGTKEELEKIMKQGKSTGKPVVLTAKMISNIKEYEDRTGKKY